MAVSKHPEKWTAKLMTERLRRHYIKPGDDIPGGIFLPEVTHGKQGGRRADGLYVGFTQSRGHHLIGHEIKVSRADWLQELAAPEKAEVWASQCHAWYIVAPSTDIVKPEELPHGWGLMVPNPRTITRLDIVVKAELHPGREPDWVTMHSVLKKMDTERAAAIAEARRKAKADANAEIEAEVDRRLGYAERATDKHKVKELQQLLADIAQALGVDTINAGSMSWGDSISVEELGKSFGKYLLADRDISGAMKMHERQLRNAEQSVEHALRQLREARNLTEKFQTS